MSPSDETSDESQRRPELAQGAIAGLVVLWTRAGPASLVLPLDAGKLVLGRGLQEALFGDDERVSREHCQVDFDGTLWAIRDLGSRNGTFVKGSRLEGTRSTLSGQVVLRVGRNLLWAVPDVRPYGTGVLVRDDGLVLGGSLKRAWAEIELAAHAGSTLCLRGESGTGKELAARAFHDASAGAAAPFVGVNCAAIPEGVAERLLFGARRGAFSGAASDVEGYVQAANQGTLFLDEIAELDLRVQAKLLRVLETREVMALGATRPDPIELKVVAASHADLREEVQAGRFREDLYYRIGRPEVRIVALRERLDELPFLIQRTVMAEGLGANARVIEACLLRAWPGNVRELLGEMKRAAHRALRAGNAEVDAHDLDEEAGLRLSDRVQSEEVDDDSKASILPDDARIEAALSEAAGNVTQAARTLGVHRNQLRRWLAKRASSRPPKT
jgi:transcriptional regulator of acetoin/glycerol metabolism